MTSGNDAEEIRPMTSIHVGFQSFTRERSDIISSWKMIWHHSDAEDFAPGTNSDTTPLELDIFSGSYPG